MEYQLLKHSGDTAQVPLLLLRRLAELTDLQLRVALAILRDGQVDPPALLAEFPTLASPPAALETILAYWAGAGLLKPLSPPAPPPAPTAPQKAARPSAGEIAQAARQDPQVATLLTESQNLFGALLNENDSVLLASLYLQEHLPVELILTGIAHFVALGKRSVRYIARVLLSWREEGICTVQDLERHLALLALRQQREEEVCSLMGLASPGFTSSERTLIARWYEEYHFGPEMIGAACQRAGGKNTVRYLNGMLKKWHARGYTAPADLAAEGPANVQPAGREIDPEQDLLLRRLDRIPVYKKRGEGL